MLKEGLLQILNRIYEERGFDFRQYKESSLRRRIERRLRATKTVSYEEYLKVLDKDPGEYKKLIDDLTIKVTEFFRDPEAWEVLSDRVLPEIIERKTRDEGRGTKSSIVLAKRSSVTYRPVLRIWSAGCATGQEAYSVAILLDQLLGERKDDLKIDIWGTDIDRESLLKAQQAEYKPDMIKAVPENILNEYFDFDGDFMVKCYIKDRVHFKSQDLVLNEPLRQMDLILCRNVAIYFERPLQEKIFMDFYNGLNEKGYLFLGKAETLIGPAQEKFKPVDKRWRIYQKEN